MALLIDCSEDELRAALHNLIADLRELNGALPPGVGSDAVVCFAQVVQQVAGLIDLLDGGERDA